MKTAGVAELKASLSEFLSKVKAGEELIITDRGKPVAKIVPIDRAEAEIPSHLLHLERAGLARIPKHKLPKGFWDIPRPKDRSDRAVKTLISEREESR